MWFYLPEDYGGERHQFLLHEAAEWRIAHSLVSSRPGIRVRVLNEVSAWLISVGRRLEELSRSEPCLDCNRAS